VSNTMTLLLLEGNW